MTADQLAACGVSWDREAAGRLIVPDTGQSEPTLNLVDHVWDAAALEGNRLSRREVASLISSEGAGGEGDGSTDDVRQVLALAAAYCEMVRLVAAGEFALDRAMINSLHLLVARHEALDAGQFRGEGSVHGGGRTVSLGGGDYYRATSKEGDGGAALRDEFEAAVAYLQEHVSSPVERALAYFCIGTFHQFFFDGNKRTSRLMMNGMLLASGHEAISVPYGRRAEYNNHLRTLYTKKDATPLMGFIADC